MLAASYYPLAATYTKANLFGVPPTLDGTAFLARHQPGDYGAIQWLNANVTGAPVILEATGGEYSDYARISTFTGLPAVLGWGGHELQWRGNYTEPGKREPDIDTIYQVADKSTALALLKKYNVRYVMAGRMEREKGYDAARPGQVPRLHGCGLRPRRNRDLPGEGVVGAADVNKIVQQTASPRRSQGRRRRSAIRARGSADAAGDGAGPARRRGAARHQPGGPALPGHAGRWVWPSGCFSWTPGR